MSKCKNWTRAMDFPIESGEDTEVLCADCLADSLEESNERQVEAGRKYDEDKPRLELLPPQALHDLGYVLAYGAKKYGEHNWRKVSPPSRYLGAALRHIVALLNDEEYDEETFQSHALHAIASLMFYYELSVDE